MTQTIDTAQDSASTHRCCGNQNSKAAVAKPKAASSPITKVTKSAEPAGSCCTETAPADAHHAKQHGHQS